MANGITAERTVEAITGSGGYVSVIAKRLGCSQRHVYNLINKFATAEEALEEERARQLDFAEGKLQEQIKAGNMTAIIFYLKTQGRTRGYVERQEHEVSGPGGGAVEHEVKLDFSGLTVEEITEILSALDDGEG